MNVEPHMSDSGGMNVGDRVKLADAIAATSIPAYRAMRGRVVAVELHGLGSFLRVHWDCDASPEPNLRRAWTVVLAADNATEDT